MNLGNLHGRLKWTMKKLELTNVQLAQLGKERNAHSSEIELKGNKAWLKGVPWKRNTSTLLEI